MRTAKGPSTQSDETTNSGFHEKDVSAASCFVRVVWWIVVFACCALVGVAATVTNSTKSPGSRSASQALDLRKGELIERVVCVGNQTQTYALYLPSSYTTTRTWPILYAFDPGARGKLPVERFKDAAEKYGWIVAGSNNSRNGPMQVSIDAWKAIWDDTHDRLSIDERRVYTTGFSGGSRTAVFFATACKDCVAGVIGGGAGFPNGIPPTNAMHFVYFGIVGLDDFNFPEMKALDEALTKVGMPHQVRTWSGRHEWAPAAVQTEAVEWIELQAIAAGIRQRDEKLIGDLWDKYSAMAKNLEAEQKLYEASQALSSLIGAFKGLHETNQAEKHLGELRETRAVKDALREERQQIAKQRDTERELYTLMAAASTETDLNPSARVHAAFAELQKSAKAETDTGARRVARRVAEGMYVGLFEQGVNLLQVQKSYTAATKKFELAVQVGTDRPGGYYYLAQAYALSGNRKKSLQALKTAVEKGFSDLSAISQSKAFESLHDEPQYQQILESMKRAN